MSSAWWLKLIDRKTTINDVVVDPSISEKLRDHQREGVLVSPTA